MALRLLDISWGGELGVAALRDWSSSATMLQAEGRMEAVEIVARLRDWEPGELAALCGAGEKEGSAGLVLSLLDISGASGLTHAEVGQVAASIAQVQRMQPEAGRLTLIARDYDWDGGSLLETAWSGVVLKRRKHGCGHARAVHRRPQLRLVCQHVAP